MGFERSVKIEAPAPAARNRHVLVSALGVTQILAWGSSYYLPAVLAAPIARDTGWSLASVVAGLSCGLLLAGLVSPITGRLIQRQGGRPVLAASSLLLAAAHSLLATATVYPFYLLAWLLMGLGMSSGLYDAGFATLGRLYGQGARGAITNLTLFGGFASTVCWPLSAFLVEHGGWRIACLSYAAIHLAICLPLHLWVIPPPPTAAPEPAEPGSKQLTTRSRTRTRFILLASIQTLAAMIASMLSVHLLTLLQLRGVGLAAAVGLGALVGPSQVGARVAELLIGRNRHHPIWTMLTSVSLLAAGVWLLLTSQTFVALALILYGAGNGIHTIARGALPLVLFDPQQYAALMGKLATPSLIVQAAAPSIGALLLGMGGGNLVLTTLALAATANVGLCACLIAAVRR
ncbi:MFS transporter [Mesorhizobium sp. M2D.F.Ca.ET.185.01.1.1]|nr:MFS transporter [Mesorhizobium sp. M2D.F.Ca.ET.140.01.1.1]TGP13572.1 MFS transporter [Mesorhizobium sp. M2D.F.Ca.ET.233.01.1.1]TGP28608.1 MFS transporter [Mesorhizobium sp. M2D.F.Ca.ET.232.01.1.1]TGP56291.1 MFS transporter [Mesorhizobium sp. M2D.F.Ca.ET.226.01.1.1]TGP65880.1 MFS transporter [Mesorhizobium sp. M2D.F.Ca.ET.225.01.1.1]TGP71306.1 MFS transporter [Mesorhizobium sp. M2D.F.Ca.ET.224.01.1.1]TGP77140.1 MFS transporter [bacterium M00.F.Ca.ET.227.01.1.1]TGP84510.1 MFS transporter [b